ncbi:MAG TPA: malto-oligosyltrehalose trehalohydrolase [Stellaceae bacterium]|nr:malto-oligosyltrehalose trehalohydrolase [Stellaceae bacterium]
MRRRHELPFGAELAAGGVRFRLWAPRASSAALVLATPAEGPIRLPMSPQPSGWWSLTTPQAKAGTRYRFGVDDGDYPDPASRAQPDGVHGASEVVDPGAYDWHDDAWRGRAWEDLVIYELHLGTFSEQGGFAGAITHLDDLVRLGVTAVELMPIAQFAGKRNWGYDGVQLFAPSSAYGRPDELKALVAACHARGLAILLDVVYNHFGPEGNYLHAIAADFFTDRHDTPWGAAIDYDGPNSRPVRDFMVHNALYWLEEYHFDGLRLDAVHAIADDSHPDIVSEIAEIARARIADRPVHLVLENDNNEARRLVRADARPTRYTAQWNDDLHHALHVLVTGRAEGYYGDYAVRPGAHLGRALAEGFAYQGEPSPFRDGRQRGEPSGTLPATAFVAFLQNHDQVGNTPFGTRIATAAPDALVHAAVAIVLLSPQIPLLFMGEEWASARPFLFFCDFAPPLDEAVREGRRREFAQYPEFADPAARERIPDPTAEATFAASRLDWSERERPPHAMWLVRYRHLLALRSKAIAPRLAGMAPGGRCICLGPAAAQVEWRLGDGARLLLLANFAAAPVPVGLPPRLHLLYSSASVEPGGELPAACAAFYLLPAAPA